MSETHSRILGGLWGLVVGDALGVPVEFCSRAERDRDPVSDFRGYGTHHQPPGTWSDDTSLTLCTIDALLRTGEDYQAVGQMFVRWLRAEVWTPHGEVFDVGNTTADAIRRLDQGVPPLQAGGDDELSNGNGSLMRSLPVALWFSSQPSEIIVEAAHRFSALTHRHPRSQVGCAVFCLIAKLLLAGCDTEIAIEEACTEADRYYRPHPFLAELQAYSVIRPAATLRRVNRDQIRASGYVVDTLQASLWCLLNAHSFEAAVLAAVNLGDDADTTGAITGALAGIRFGVEAIPLEWRRKLVRHHELDALFNALVTGIKSK